MKIKENEKIKAYADLYSENKKLTNINCFWCFLNYPQLLEHLKESLSPKETRWHLDFNDNL